MTNEERVELLVATILRIRELSRIVANNPCEFEEPYESDTGAGTPSCVYEKLEGDKMGVPYTEEICSPCQLVLPALVERKILRKRKSSLLSQIVNDAARRIAAAKKAGEKK